MNIKYKSKHGLIGAILGVASMIAGCGDSGAPGPSGQAGQIDFEEGSSIAVSAGSTRDVILSLKNSSGVSGQQVFLATSDALIADVSPTTCTLSSSSEASSKCSVKVHGKSTGAVTLFARSDVYPHATLAASVTATVVYGSLSVATSSGAFVTTSTISQSFNATGAAPYQMALKARITGSSGIVDATGAIVNFSSPAAGVSFNPPQCQITSATPACDTTVSLPAATTTVVVVQVVGGVVADYTGYQPITISAIPNATPTYGQIVVSTQSGNSVPAGMKAPLFVDWSNPSVSDTLTVTLQIVGSGVAFYSHDPGDNINIKTATSQICVMRYSGSAATDVKSCGFGLVGEATSGTVTVNATVASKSTHTYVVAPLTLGAVAPAATRRAVTFTNRSSQPIFVGITGGAASAYISPATPSVVPGPASANLKPGAGSLCGPSNPRAACPIGTSCIQGGSAPSTDISNTPFNCYYDQKTPTNGYQLAAGSGSTTFEISGSSLSPSGIIWSGNFYGRTGCDPVTGKCENATCAGKAQGLACGPGTGPSPGVNTLAELTFQAYPAVDFYDVSIINGVNFAAQFGPTNVAASATDPYACSTAGSLIDQNGGYPGTAGNVLGLPAANWTLAPTLASSFPPGVTVTGDASSYFRVVSPSAGSAKVCARDLDCTGAVDTTCGFSMTSVITGTATFASSDRRCGKPVAWMSADAIWGFNATATNSAPFAFQTTWSNGLGGTVSVGDLQLCVNKTYSAYTANGSSSGTPAFPIQPIALACGGVMWGATQSTLPPQNPLGNAGLNLTRPSQDVLTANANWLNYVLPTIKWLKQACPTCYTYPFDDPTSTFTCSDVSRKPKTDYGLVFSDLK